MLNNLIITFNAFMLFIHCNPHLKEEISSFKVNRARNVERDKISTMSSFKETCINLRREGKTLSEIVALAGRPKTSVYFHIRTIPLSSEKLKLMIISHKSKISLETQISIHKVILNKS